MIWIMGKRANSCYAVSCIDMLEMHALGHTTVDSEQSQETGLSDLRVLVRQSGKIHPKPWRWMCCLCAALEPVEKVAAFPPQRSRPWP